MTNKPSLRAAVPKRTTDRDGQDILLVPLGGSFAPFAKVFPEDYAALLRSGVSPRWSASHDGYVRVGGARGSALVARVIMGADNRYQVVYLDKDRTNLRRDNLALVPYKRRARKPRKPRDIEQHLFIAEKAQAQARP